MAAEWCQHDDVTLHWEGANGERATVRARFEGLTLPEVFREWHRHKAGNIRLSGAGDRPVIVVHGPPCQWRVVHVEANGGWVLGLTQPEYGANQVVVLSMHREVGGVG